MRRGWERWVSVCMWRGRLGGKWVCDTINWKIFVLQIFML